MDLRPSPQDETHAQFCESDRRTYGEGAHRLLSCCYIVSNWPICQNSLGEVSLYRGQRLTQTLTDGQSRETRWFWSPQPKSGHLYHSPSLKVQAPSLMRGWKNLSLVLRENRVKQRLQDLPALMPSWTQAVCGRLPKSSILAWRSRDLGALSSSWRTVEIWWLLGRRVSFL